MIEPTGEMVFAAEREVGIFGYLLSDSQKRKVVAAVLAIVERDRCMEPAGHAWHPLAKRAPVMHLATKGDAHMHCCGIELLDLPSGDRWQFDPHGITCKGRVLSDPCLCGADLGPPWDSTPHQRGTPGCRGAAS